MRHCAAAAGARGRPCRKSITFETEGCDMVQMCRKGRKCNSIEVVRHLLTLEGDRRIDVGAKNNAAFKVACIQGNTGVVRQLLSLTGDRTVSVVSGTDASDNGAYLAMVGGHMDTVREILQQRGEHEAFTFTSTDMRRLMQAQEQVQTVVDEPEPEMLMV
jgi:hypothetical protein